MINKLNSLKDKLLNIKKKNIDCCPHCKSKSFIKYGSYKGNQRYKCRNINCDRTFSVNTEIVWSYSKKDISTWEEYITLMIDGATLRQISAQLNINIATAFYWRQKITATLLLINKAEELKEYVEISKFILLENFKGERGASYKEKSNVVVVSAIDNTETVLSEKIGKGFITLNMIKDGVYKKMSAKALIIPHADRVLNAIAKTHNNLIGKDTEYIAPKIIHKYNMNVQQWLIPFRGVATKYLNSYLSWHIAIYKSIMKNSVELMENLICHNFYKKCGDF